MSSLAADCGNVAVLLIQEDEIVNLSSKIIRDANV